MATKFSLLGVLITGIQLIVIVGCGKEKSKPCSRITPFSFNVTSEFSPQQEIYNIGDTIYYNSSFPKLLNNSINNQPIDYSNSTGIEGGLSMSIFDTITRRGSDALDKFQVIDIIGISRPLIIANKGKLIEFNESPSVYQFKAAIILKSKGIFQLASSDLGSVGLQGQNCTNAGFGMTVTNTDKNIHLFEYALGYTPDNMLQQSIFCFRVH